MGNLDNQKILKDNSTYVRVTRKIDHKRHAITQTLKAKKLNTVLNNEYIN